jgi:hypothetical protein
MKKFIGGGFPGIRECIDEKNILTKENIEKREFEVRKILSINQILKPKTNITNNSSEELVIVKSNNSNNSINKNKFNIDINRINNPKINKNKL